MRYHPRIQMPALKVGFHAFLLHQYKETLQTYSHISWVQMPDGKFLSWLLFNHRSKISQYIFNCMVYDNKVQRIRG